VSKKITILLSIGLLASLPPQAWSKADYYTPENIHRFADWLYHQGDYLRAAGEYQRYLFSANLSVFPDSLLYKIGLCYQLGDMPKRAKIYYQRIIDHHSQSELSDRAQYQIARIYFDLGKYDESISYIETKVRRLAFPQMRLRMNLLLGCNYLFQKRWKLAHHHLASLLSSHKNSQLDSLIIGLNDFALQGERLPYKSGTLAGLLSTTIPGMGKLYVGRFTDGLYSFILVGLTGWQAYEGFHRDGTHSSKGWIYGSLGAIFYLGNIYGSVVAAKIHNEKVEDNLLQKIRVQLNWDIP